VNIRRGHGCIRNPGGKTIGSTSVIRFVGTRFYGNLAPTWPASPDWSMTDRLVLLVARPPGSGTGNKERAASVARDYGTQGGRCHDGYHRL
jgi:hypothetical protein